MVPSLSVLCRNCEFVLKRLKRASRAGSGGGGENHYELATVEWLVRTVHFLIHSGLSPKGELVS